MKKVNKYIVVSVVLAALIISFAVALILYDMRVFEISFIKRPDETTAAETTTATETTEPETTEPSTDTAEDTGADDTTTGPEIPKSVFDELHESIKSASAGSVTPTEQTYGEGLQLLRIDGLTLPESQYIFGDMISRERFKTTYSTKVRGLRVFTPYTASEFRCAADIYMGYLVVSDGTSLTFYNGKFEQIYKYESEEEELIFAYERDEEDRPLFKLGDDFYYIDEETHELTPSDFDARDSRGLNYNYPTTFGKFEGQFTAFRSGSKYGIKNAEGERVRGAIYEKGYNYSEGLGLIVYDDETCYMNEKVKIAIEGEKMNIHIIGRTDENGIGALYFDGGYVFTRIVKYHPLYKKNPERYNIVEEDADVVIDKNGNIFELPAGCTAKAYSDQRILVENGGKYGFYAVKGAWIADTVYSYATPYYEGLAVVGSGNAKGVIDMDGNFVIPLSYSHISVCSGGIIVCYSSTTGYEIYVKTEI